MKLSKIIPMKIAKVGCALAAALISYHALIAPSATAATESAGTEAGGDEAAELAKKLNNPVSSLISVPFQSNWDFNLGDGNGQKYTLNIQPVVPDFH